MSDILREGPNTDAIKGLNKAIAAAKGQPDPGETYLHNTDVTRHLDALTEAIRAGGGGGGITKEEFDAEVQARIDGDWYISHLNTTKQTITVDDVEMSYSDWATYAVAHPKTIMQYASYYYYPTGPFSNIWYITFVTVTSTYVEMIALSGGYLSFTKYDYNKVADVRVSGESIVKNGVASIPTATSTAYGLVKMGTRTFTRVVNTNEYEVKSATQAQIDDRDPMTPSTTTPQISISNIDYAVMKSLTDDKSPFWTEAAKTAAQQRLGLIPVEGAKF